MPHHPSPETIIICYGPATNDKSSNNKNLSLRMKLKDWLQNSKSHAPSSKPGHNHNLSLGMKLGRRPSFKTPSPALHHPSPETIIICHYDEAEGLVSKLQVQGSVIHVWKQLWFVIKNEARPKETSISCHYRQVQCPIIQVQKQSSFVIKNEAGPKA